MYKYTQDKIRKMVCGIKEFAFLPTNISGEWIWLKHYYAYYRGGLQSENRLFLWSRSPEDFSPYSKKSLCKNKNLISITTDGIDPLIVQLFSYKLEQESDNE